LGLYDAIVARALRRPWLTVVACGASFVASLALYPLIGLSFFPRTDAGMFVINVKAPTGSRISVTESEVAKVEALIRRIVSPNDLDVILSNIGVTPGFSSIYTSNSAAHTAFAQVSLKDGHKVAAMNTWPESSSESLRKCRSSTRIFNRVAWWMRSLILVSPLPSMCRWAAQIWSGLTKQRWNWLLKYSASPAW